MSWMTKSLSSYYTLNVITNGVRYLYFDEMETNCLVCEPLKEAGVKTNIHYVLIEDTIKEAIGMKILWVVGNHVNRNIKR